MANTALSFPAASSAVNRLVPVIVFAGESNAGGYALNSDATADELAPRPSVQILNNTTLLFETLDIGVNNIIDHAGTDATWRANRHGWELQLANRVDDGDFLSGTMYLVKTGQGSSTISQWAEGQTYWTKFVQRINAAKALLKAQGKIPVFYVWYSQGINDALAATNVTTWKNATIAHLAKIRALLGYVPFMVTKLPAAYPTYNVAIDEIVNSDGFAYAIQTSDAVLFGDGNHWTYAGMKLIAGRMADKVIDTVGELEAYAMMQNNILSLRLPSTITPGAPTSLVIDDTANTATWTLAAEYDADDHEYSTNYAATTPTWTTATTNSVVVGNVNIAIGAFAVRVKAGPGRNAGPVLLNATAFTSIGAVPTWGSFVKTQQTGEFLEYTSGSLPIGATTVSTIDATQAFTVEAFFTSLTNAVVVALDVDNDTGDYAWNTGKVYKALTFHNAGNLFAGQVDNSTTNIQTSLSLPCRVKFVKSGNDIQVYLSTNDGGNYTLKTTYTGALTGVTQLYVKAIFALSTAGNKIKVTVQ